MFHFHYSTLIFINDWNLRQSPTALFSQESMHYHQKRVLRSDVGKKGRSYCQTKIRILTKDQLKSDV